MVKYLSRKENKHSTTLTSQLQSEKRQRTRGFYCVAKLLAYFTNLVFAYYKNHPFVLQGITLG